MKICKKCGNAKSKTEFSKSKTCKDGFTIWCKDCFNKNRKEKYGDYYKNNKDKRKEYLIKNKKKIQEYYSNTKDKRKKIKEKWEEQNKEKRREYMRNYRHERLLRDPNFKTKERIRAAFALCLKKNHVNKRTKMQFYVGVTREQYVEYFFKNYPNEFLQITEPGKYHIDHIIPCSAYDFTDPEEIRKCWQPENLRIITNLENWSKNDNLNFELIKKFKIEYLLPKNILLNKR